MRLQLKDIITVALLGVVSFVISMVGGMVTQLFGVYGIFVHVSIGSLLVAPVYFVMCNKVEKRGTILLYYLIMGIAYTIMGFLPMLFIMVVAGIIGEIIIYKTKYYSDDKLLSISYIVSQLIYALHGFFFILILGISGLVATFPKLFTIEKATMIYNTFFDVKNIVIIIIVQLIVSYIGTVLGKSIRNKFFKKNHNSEGILK